MVPQVLNDVLNDTRITRRGVLAGLATAAVSPARTKRRPNFLFLLADDHAGYVMGCDGNGQASTPSLDRLAREGTRFEAHYCNAPVCTPSRQSFFTGQLPHAAGVTVLSGRLSPDKPTLAKQFRKAGYQTAVFGKMHFNRPAAPGLFGFDVMMTEDEIARAWKETIWPKTIPPNIPTKPAEWRPFRDPARTWLNSEDLPFARRDTDMQGTFIANQAIEYMEQNRGKPFALWTSFREPHSPFDFPVEDFHRISPDRFSVPRVGPEDAGQIPLIFRDLSPEEKRGIIAAYYTSVSFVDRNIGRVLAALKRLRLEDDTFVVYMADHGYSLGQHGRFEKHCGYDPALRVPLIMRYPGKIRRGVISDLTEHVDVTATIADVMELDPLPVMHGQSLRPYLRGSAPDRPRDHIFSEYLENEEAYIRTKDWKYIFCSGKRAREDGYRTDHPAPGRYHRLYNLKEDPGEFTDVAAAQPAKVDEFQTLLLRRFRSTHPDREAEPARATREEAIEFYLRPRDAPPA